MVGAWDHARSILERLPQFAAVSHPAISKGLCKLIHTTIEPLYRRYVQVTLVKKRLIVFLRLVGIVMCISLLKTVVCSLNQLPSLKLWASLSSLKTYNTLCTMTTWPPTVNQPTLLKYFEKADYTVQIGHQTKLDLDIHWHNFGFSFVQSLPPSFLFPTVSSM